MEDLVRSTKSAVIAKQAIKEVYRIRLSVKDIISFASTSCKKIPKPIKIIGDRLFYRCTNNIG